MGVIMEAGYSLPGGDEPLVNARIAHSGNWHTVSTVTASTTATDYFADGPDNSLTYEKWKPTALPADWEADFGSNKVSDYCIIAAHTLGTNACNIKIQKWDGVSAWDDIIGTTAITDDMPIFCIFAPVTIDQLRVRVTSGSGNPTIGVIKFGSALQMPQAIYGGHSPIDLARQTELRSNYSETGEFLGRTKQRSMLSSSFQWSHLTAAWVRTNIPTLQTAVESEPFCIAWRPETFSEVAYGQTDSVPQPSNTGAKDLMSLSLDMRARAYD